MGLYEMQMSKPGFVKQRRSLDLRDNPAMQPISIVLKVGSVPDMETCGPHSTLKYQSPNTIPRLTGLGRDFYSEKPIGGTKVTVSHTGDREPAFKTNRLGVGAPYEQLLACVVGRSVSRILSWSAHEYSDLDAILLHS
jgi:hypothetical protein